MRDSERDPPGDELTPDDRALLEDTVPPPDPDISTEATQVGESPAADAPAPARELSTAATIASVEAVSPAASAERQTPPLRSPERLSAVGDLAALPTVDPELYARGKEIARGGMGRIIEARDRKLCRNVAIKELLSPSATLEKRFEREVKITARLQHPAIIAVYDAGRWPSGEAFFTMKHVAGKPLSQVIAKATELRDRLALLPTVLALADALAYAHSEGVVHRDLKPGNVLVGSFGETVVIDWGLAKDLGDTDAQDPLASVSGGGGSDLTVVGEAMGTPAYMPPEQARGETVDERADVYALGAILYHLLSGQTPYAETKPQTPQELLDTVKETAPMELGEAQPAIPPALVTIARKAMARNRADRYPSAGELAADLRRYQTGQLVGAHQYSTWALVERWIRRHRAAVGVAVVMMTVLIAVGIFSFSRITRERDRAEQQKTAAETQRTVAEENRGEVEALLDFMLTDLRDKLAPIGKSQLLGMVAERASDYFAKRPIDWGHPTEAEGRAIAHDNVGLVLQAQGKYGAALAEFRKGKSIALRLVAIDPQNITRQKNLLVSQDNVGHLLELQGDLDGARAEYSAARAIAELLIEREPSEPDWQRLLSTCHDNVANLDYTRGKLADALAEYRAGKAIRQRLVEADPGNPTWQRDLIVSYERVGNILRDQGDIAGALEEHSAGRVAAEQLVERAPNNADDQSYLAVMHEKVGDLNQLQGDYAAALVEYRSSRKIRQRLVELDPQNADWQRGLSLAYDRVGTILAVQGDGAGALAEYRAGLQIARRLLAIEPGSALAQRALSSSHDQVARTLAARGDHADAIAEYAASKALGEALVEADPTNPQLQLELATTYLLLAPLLAKTGDEDTSRELLGRAAEIYERTADDAGSLYNAACVNALADKPDKAFEMLEKAVDKGYRNAAWAGKDTDLTSLREDPRWRPLLERMTEVQ